MNHFGVVVADGDVEAIAARVEAAGGKLLKVGRRETLADAHNAVRKFLAESVWGFLASAAFSAHLLLQ